MTTKDHTAALLPCPFCGGTTIHVSPPTCKRTDKYDPADRGFPIVHCGLCGAEANGKNWDESCAIAIAAWNRRAQPQQPAGWISVEDRMPCDEEIVLVFVPNGRYQKVDFDCWRMQREAPLGFSSATIETGMGWDDHEWEEVTHWMPLPPPPGAHPSQQEDDERGTREKLAYIQRYSESHDEGGGVYEDEDGDFVRLSDVIAAIADSAGEGGKNG